jgi:metal-sulfur cluster biosynthetic enzyme
MVNKEDVLNALRNVIDPEIGLDVVNLGLIYDLKVENDSVFVKMTMTVVGCPLTSWILTDAENKIREIPDVKEVKVELVWDPPWSVDRISDEARKMLGL